MVVGTIGDDLRVDYTAFGDTTVLAARLQAAAAPGAVLVSQRTAELVRGYFQLEEVTPVQVKERTVHPLRVTGLGTRTARIASGDELSPFTGRDRELAELQRALEVAVERRGPGGRSGRGPRSGQVPAGLEFRRLAGPHAAVLEGRCLSYGAGIAYLPLFELVRNACGIAADDAPDLVGTKIERKIKALELDVSLAHYLRHAFGLPTGDPGVAALDPQDIRARTFEALRQLLVAEAGPGRWWCWSRTCTGSTRHRRNSWPSSSTSCRRCRSCCWPPTGPVTPRPGPASRSRPSWRCGRCQRRPAKRSWPRCSTAGTGCGGDRRAGRRQPVLPRELARATRDQAADAEGVAVPETVQQVLAARIDRSDRRSEGGDSGGRGARPGVLTRPGRRGLGRRCAAGGAAAGAERAGVSPGAARRPERTFVFTHALTREVAYDGMLEARRRELHGRPAPALEYSQASQRFEHGELLAYHYARSADPARAIPYLAAAGARAKDRYANEEAPRCLPPRDRADRGTAMLASGRLIAHHASAKAWASSWSG